MDLSIQSVGTESVLSGKPFAPGDRIWSVLYRSPEGGYERADVFEEEREDLKPEEGAILCQWGHRVKPVRTSEADEKRAELQTAEEVFLSLFEADEGDGEEAPAEGVKATRERLKFFLSLQLERKRILRPLGGGRYRHMPSKREFRVPQLELTPELVASHLKEDLGGSSGEEEAGTPVQ